MTHSRTDRGPGSRCADGFTLIEVLVAVFVLGIGVLGVAGLQVVSMQNNREALMRAEAVMMAGDIIDRMRANPGGGYAPLDLDDDPDGPDCVANTCTENQMATFDQEEWRSDITDLFGDEGSGSIALNGAVFTVRVQWENNTIPCRQVPGSPEICFVELTATL